MMFLRFEDKFRGCLVGCGSREMFFTAYCLIISKQLEYSNMITGESQNCLKIIRDAYPGWLSIQKELCLESDYLKLYEFDMFINRRADVMKHSLSFRKNKVGTINNPANDSQGCEGLLRVVPIGLYFSDKDDESYNETDMLGAEVAAMSNGHELGYIPAAALTHIIRALSERNISLIDAVNEAVSATVNLFMGADHIGEFKRIMQKAMSLSESYIDADDAISQLGEGKSADETLAIAVYCALRYKYDFEKAVRTASGNSTEIDSIGSVCGSILGTHLGYKKISDSELIVKQREKHPNILITARCLCRNTFESFIVNDDNRDARRYAERFAGNNYSKPLCILGKHGTGKTHLLYAVSNFIHENAPELNVIMTDGEKFSKEMVDAVRTRKDLEVIREKYMKCDVLLFDDVDSILGKEMTMEEFVLLYNELYESGKRILLTSSGFKDLKSDEIRFISRCFFGDYVVIREN